MRVLYWTGLFWPRIGGAEVLAMDYVKALTSSGHEVLIVTDQNPRDTLEVDAFESARIHRLPFVDVITSRDLYRVKAQRDKVAAIKSDFQPDVIHLNSMGLDALFHDMTLSAVEAPTVLTVHGLALDYQSADNTLLKRTLDSVNWVVGVSSSMLENVIDLAPEISDRSSVILNALSEPDWVRIGAFTKDPGRGFTMLCAGRLVKEKGIDLAVKALQQLLDDGVEAKLIVAGDGPELGNLKALARPLIEAGACEFTGWITPPDIYPMIHNATVVVVPSRWEEPFGLIALQAGQCGRPVVAARSGGLEEVVDDGVSGMLFDRNDHFDLAGKLKSLASDPELQNSMGLAGRHRAVELFSMNRYVGEYMSLYQRISG